MARSTSDTVFFPKIPVEASLSGQLLERPVGRLEATLAISLRSISHNLGSTANPSSSSAVKLDTPQFTIVLACAVAILSYVVPKMEGELMLNPQTAWPLWPGCAILVAALMLVPTKIWPVLIPASYAGFVLYDLQAGVPVSSIAWFIPADTIQVLTAALGLRYCFEGVPRFNNINSLAKYYLFAVLLGPFAAAFVSAPGIPGNYWTSWRISFLSEVLSFITLAPAILSWVSEGPAWMQKRSAYHVEFVMLLTATVLLSYLTFGTSSLSEFPVLLYALVPFLLWSALRFGSIGITSSMIIVSFLSVWGVVHGEGPFKPAGTATTMFSLQLFLIVAATPFLALTALVEDRKIVGERLAKLSHGLIQAQETERVRIARELHDDINQRLAIVAIDLEQVRDDPSQVQTSVQRIRIEVMEISSDVEALSHELHSSKLEYLGVVAGMKGWCREFAERQRMEIDFNSDVKTVVPLDVALPLFRVLQEALHNVAKHSGVKRVEVQLREDSGEIHLVVDDSGKGFDVKAAMQSHGLGLTSMRERIRLVNGSITIESKLASGTTIHARVPLESEPPTKRKAV